MARIRTIKPAFFRHGGLFDAEQETGLPLRVAFAGLWTACDRDGRFCWKPRELKLDALPHDLVDFSRVLDALLTRGFIRRYSLDGEVFGFIPTWSLHQVVNNKETASILPDPEKCSIESIGCTRASRVDDAKPTPLCNFQGEGKGREGNGTGKEGEGETPRKRSATPDFELPDWINKAHWDAWHSCPKRKKATPQQKQLSVDKLNSWREAGQDYAGALENAAVGGYQGLFLPDAQKAGNQRASKPSQMTESARVDWERAENEKSKRLLFGDVVEFDGPTFDGIEYEAE